MKWSKDCILVAGTAANQNPKFEITDTELYVSFITVSTPGNIKLFKQSESGFKRTINLNKYLSKTASQMQMESRYLDFLIDASFQDVNRFFVLSFKDEDGQESQR